MSEKKNIREKKKMPWLEIQENEINPIEGEGYAFQILLNIRAFVEVLFAKSIFVFLHFFSYSVNLIKCITQ